MTLDRILVHLFVDLTTLKIYIIWDFTTFFYLFFIEYHELINSFLLPFKIGGGAIESKKHIQKRFQKQFDLIVSPLSPSNYVETWLPGLS